MSKDIGYTMDDYVREMIEGGYRSSKDFSPLKCHRCESKHLEPYDHYYEGNMNVEYGVRCKSCGEEVARWSYGSWDI